MNWKTLLSYWIIFTTVAILVFFLRPGPTTYSGKINLNQEEYNLFKTELLMDHTSISKLYILNSNPLLVDFEIKVRQGHTFPFGDINHAEKIAKGIFVIGLLPLVIALLASLLIFRREKQKEKPK